MILSFMQKLARDAWSAHPNIGCYEPAALRREAYLLERFLWDGTVKHPLTVAHFVARGELCADVVHAAEAVANPTDREEIRRCIDGWKEDHLAMGEAKHP